ncbi:MAG TPA: ABC transporter permease [Trebonia sp.]|nr:ABC transporter permease [Trebonia sp.]
MTASPEPGAGQSGLVTDRSTGGAVDIPANRSWWERHGSGVVVAVSRLAVLAVALAAWQVMSGPVLDPHLVSSPSAVWDRLVQWSGDGTLWPNTWVTVQEIVIGYVIGAAAGVVFGFAIAAQARLSRVLDPFIIALYSIPKVALAPLFIVWFGIGLEMKVVLAAATVFFLVFLNTAAGVREIDQALLDAVRLMGGRRRDLLLKVTLPGSMTGVITGLRVSVPYALIGAVIGELVATNRGLGYLINDAASNFDTAGVFAALVVLSVIAAVLNVGVNALARRTNRWKPLDGGE